jgi:hypothetical protein
MADSFVKSATLIEKEVSPTAEVVSETCVKKLVSLCRVTSSATPEISEDLRWDIYTAGTPDACRGLLTNLCAVTKGCKENDPVYFKLERKGKEGLQEDLLGKLGGFKGRNPPVELGGTPGASIEGKVDKDGKAFVTLSFGGLGGSSYRITASLKNDFPAEADTTRTSAWFVVLRCLTVGAWAVNTEDATDEGNWTQKENEDKIALVSAAAEAVYTEALRKQPEGLTGRFPAFCLLAAPEYFFVYKHTSFDCHHVDFAVVTSILDELGKICARFPGLILIPGTILGRRPIAKAKLLSGLTSHQKRLESKLAAKHWNKEKDMVAESKRKIDAGATHFGFNAAPILFHDGSSLTKLSRYKNADVSECWDEATVHLSPEAPTAVEVDGLSLGIEICQDHTFGILKCFGVPAVDLQVVLSAHTDLVSANYDVKLEGCIVHACSIAKDTAVTPQSKAIAETLRNGTVGGKKIEMVNLVI